MALEETNSTCADEPPIPAELVPIALRIDEHREQGVFDRAVERITAAVEAGTVTPLWTLEQMLAFMDEDEATTTAFEDVLLASATDGTVESALRCFRTVPDEDQFLILRQHNIGPDGVEHTSLPKYAPKTIANDVLALQAHSQQYMTWLSDTLGVPPRPGILIESAFRSDPYQVVTRVLAAALHGGRYMLAYTAAPGESQHGDYSHPAVDVLYMGGWHGEDERSQYGESDAFLRTPEAAYLAQFAAQYHLRRPYAPDLGDPTGAASRGDIAVESWHFQYDPDAEVTIAADGSEIAFQRRLSWLLAYVGDSSQAEAS